MKTLRRKFDLLPAAALVLAAMALPAHALVTCTANAGVPLLVRAEGNAEPVADFTVVCTGGIPTPAGLVVPQVNFELFLNTNISSHVTQSAVGADFSEALLLVDEPNSAVNPPQRPLLNCGNAGAPDNGPSGPGVCSTISNGNPVQSYDGTGNAFGVNTCDGIGTDPAPNTYGCGRPNAFQGRMATGGASNRMDFLGVPFDPPGAGTRIFRFTNIRADAAIFGGPNPVIMTISVNGSTAITINFPQQNVAFTMSGLTGTVGSPGVVHVAENFASSFRPQNVAFTLANGTFGGSSYTYNGGTAYPLQAAQNVPGTFYNTEDMYQWQNNTLNAPPIPNPPAGIGLGPVANLGLPLASLGFGFLGTNTHPEQDGVSSQGTRIALTFTKIPGHSTVTVPAVVFLHETASPAGNSGVMVLTDTDAAGAGPFTPGSTTIPDGGTAVYEVLFADPFAIEFADIPVIVNHSGNGTKVAVSFAPFYTGAGAGLATPTAANPTPTAVPRFVPAAGTMKLQ